MFTKQRITSRLQYLHEHSQALCAEWDRLQSTGQITHGIDIQIANVHAEYEFLEERLEHINLKEQQEKLLCQKK